MSSVGLMHRTAYFYLFFVILPPNLYAAGISFHFRTELCKVVYLKLIIIIQRSPSAIRRFLFHFYKKISHLNHLKSIMLEP